MYSNPLRATDDAKRSAIVVLVNAVKANANDRHKSANIRHVALALVKCGLLAPVLEWGAQPESIDSRRR